MIARLPAASLVVALALCLGRSPAAAEPPAPTLPSVSALPKGGAPWIRVAVVQRQPRIDLAIQGRFNLVGIRTAASLREGQRLQKVAVSAAPNGIMFGEELLPLLGVRVEPARDATINLNGQRLRGAIEILKQPDHTLLVINHVNLEDYLRGVLSKEAPHYWPVEALRAIAITARTYALFQRMNKATVDYDVTGDVLSQVYGGRAAERDATSRAVRDTEGLILTYQGAVLPAFYHSTCGGSTEHGSIMGPYDIEPLRGNIRCAFCALSPFYRWERRLSKADVSWALKKSRHGSLWPVERLDIAERTMTGRVAKIRVRGRRHVVTVSGYDFRQLFGFDGIRSTAFSIAPSGDGFVLEGRGWGHGVGLCQWGAAELARRGLSASEILAFYYPETRVVRHDDVTTR